jgi:peroxiredoxin
MSESAKGSDPVGRLVPDLALASTAGGLFRVRDEAAHGPLVLFFYIRNGTPG